MLVTQNTSHPGFNVNEDNLHIEIQETSQLSGVLNVLYQKYECERITVQTGGTVNGMLLREKLLDYVDIVVAPVLVGGCDVPTLTDGLSLTSPHNLDQLGVLELKDCIILRNCYLRLRYSVRKNLAVSKLNIF